MSRRVLNPAARPFTQGPLSTPNSSSAQLSQYPPSIPASTSASVSPHVPPPSQAQSSASASLSSEKEEDKEGYLSIEVKRGLWKEQLFFLHGASLMTVTHPGAEPKEMVSCSQIKEIRAEQNKIRYVCTNSKGADEIVELKASTNEEANDWVIAVMKGARRSLGRNQVDNGKKKKNTSSAVSGAAGGRKGGASKTAQPSQKRGILSKQSKGVWFDRYYIFIDETLRYKRQADTPDNEAIEDLRCNLIREVEVYDKDIRVIMLGGDEHRFRASTHVLAEEWSQALYDHLEWCKQKESNGNASGAELQRLSNISGWVKMKSSTDLRSKFQDYYLRLENASLKYYKRKEDNDERGTINLETVQAIRPVVSSKSPKTFEIVGNVMSFRKLNEVIYTFEAGSIEDAKAWINALQNARDMIKHLLEHAEIQKSTRILIYDRDGEEIFKTYLIKDINDLYPDEGDTPFELKVHLEHADSVSKYLFSFVKEVQRDSPRHPRYDIIACVMEQVNIILAAKMNSFMESNSPRLDHTNLGDIHSLIVWLTKYHRKLIDVYIPVSLHRKGMLHCSLFDCLPNICDRYVNGSSCMDNTNGAASHLVDHCIKVWDSVLRSPGEMLQQHNDGSFFTFMPMDTWEVLHSHLDLATETRSPILHVMIANKISVAISNIVCIIREFVENLNFEDNPVFEGFELEFLCAMANDNAYHIEEVMLLIDNFDMDEIRDRINSIYDEVTADLVSCGQSCLNRLSDIVLKELSIEMDKIFTEAWLSNEDEVPPIETVIATVKDYLEDLGKCFVPFWTKKFVHTLLESLTIAYTRQIIFREEMVAVALAEENKGRRFWKRKKLPKKSSSAPFSSPSSSGVGNIGNVHTSSALLERVCRADQIALGHIGQDINTFNKFFHNHAESGDTELFLSLIHDVQSFLMLPLESVIAQTVCRIAEYPHCKEAICDVVDACLKLRDDVAPARRNEVIKFIIANSIVEDLPPTDASDDKKPYLGQLYLKVNPFNEAKLNEKVHAEFIQRKNAILTPKSHHDLIDRVVHIMEDEEELHLLEQTAAEEDAERRKRYHNIEGTLEEKNSMTGLFQSRYFKLSTREVLSDKEDASDLIYNLTWATKKGQSVLASQFIKNLECLKILETHQPLLFDSLSLVVLLESSTTTMEKGLIPVHMYGSPYTHQTASGPQQGRISSYVYPRGFVVTHATTSSSARSYKFSKREQYVFSLTFKDGKTLELRTMKVDDLIEWINNLIGARGLNYDEKQSCWTEKTSTIPMKPLIGTKVTENKESNERRDPQRRKSDPKRQSIFVPMLSQGDGSGRKMEPSSNEAGFQDVKRSDNSNVGTPELRCGDSNGDVDRQAKPAIQINSLSTKTQTSNPSLSPNIPIPTQSTTPVQPKNNSEVTSVKKGFTFLSKSKNNSDTNSEAMQPKSPATTPLAPPATPPPPDAYSTISEVYGNSDSLSSSSKTKTPEIPSNTVNPLVLKRLSQTSGAIVPVETPKPSTIHNTPPNEDADEAKECWVSKEENWGGNHGTSSPLNDMLLRAQQLRMSKS